MNRKIKILHIQETIGSGGVERRRLSLAKHLDKDKFDQMFVCTKAFGNIPQEIKAEGFKVLPIGKLRSPFHWEQHIKVQKIISEYKPDIIHGAVFEGVTLAAFNGWLKKVPVIIIEETSDPQNRSWKGNLLMKLFARLSTAVIGVSPAVTEEYLLQKLSLSPNKVKLINNGVALPRKISTEEISLEKEIWKIEKEDFVVGSLGRMEDDSLKRYSDLIQAFAIFSRGKEKVKLLLVGGNEKLTKQYRILGDKLGLQKSLIITNYQNDVTKFYNLMDVYCLLSVRESFGLALVEAMLNKIPVIASRVGGMKYIVDHNENGFLVEPKNIEEIVEMLESYYNNPQLKTEMGENGYKKAINNYTEESYVQNIDNLYNGLKISKKYV